MSNPGPPASGWSAFPPSRRLCVSGIVALLLFTVPGAAQAPRRAQPPLQVAARAFIEGRYDEIELLTEKLDARDPDIAALKARVAIARGRYAQAEAALRPIASRAPASEAALVLGLLQQLLGRADAPAVLDGVAATARRVTDPADLARAARALRALGRYADANAAYRAAAAAAPGDAAINTAWGELFLEKYNKPEAVKSFQMALRADEKYAPALLGLAEAMADDNPPQATELARRALAINPSYAEARVLLARQAIDVSRHDEAREALEQVLAINPFSLVAHAWLAAVAYVEDKVPEFEAEAAKALAIAPDGGGVYRVAGELAAHNYRFDEAVTLTRRALTLAPRNPQALADLGVHLLRTGDEVEARTVLDASFKIDPYNAVSFNLLSLLDSLDTFTTVRDGDIVLRMQKDEAPVLGESVLALARQAQTTLAARYEFTPRGPILIEVFPKHDDFAVRNVGLPGMIGALGACFGRVVTMDSPKARPPGSFQWEATLWHELAHVVTLQMSNQRVPRWLSEGISVYEEKRAKAEWARQMDVEFVQAVEHGHAVKLRDLNEAFTDPRRVSLAYYQASLLVEHLITSFGEAGLRKLLRAYGEGLRTDNALKAALNTTLDQLQAGFDQSIDRQFGPMRRALAGPDEDELAAKPLPELRIYAAEHPQSYVAHIALGRALMKDTAWDEARQALQRAATLVPTARGDRSPHALLSQIALQQNDKPRAIAELTSLVAVDFDNIEVARQLASLLSETGADTSAAFATVHQRIAAIDPFDAEAHRVIGRFLLNDQPDAASREFRAVLALAPVDQARAHTDLAESYLRSGKRVEAKKQTLAALEIAPTYERAQELLLKLAGGQP